MAHRGMEIPKLIRIGSLAIADDIIEAYLQRLNGSWVSGNYFKEYFQKIYNHPFEHFSASLIYDEDDLR